MDPTGLSFSTLIGFLKDPSLVLIVAFLVWWVLKTTDNREKAMRERLDAQDKQFTEREKVLIAHNDERENTILAAAKEREAKLQSLLECYGEQLKAITIHLETLTGNQKELSDLVHSWLVIGRRE